MSVKPESFKIELHKNIEFLHDIYSATTRYRRYKLLDSASNKELTCLVKVIHCLMTGVIPIRRKMWENIKKSKRAKFLGHHFKDEAYKNLVESDKEDSPDE